MTDDNSARLGLVEASAQTLRDKIFAAEPGARIGSLRSIASELSVGIITVQQAARVLEHEGLLEVRRGPGGGYFGRRPDAAALERSLAGYLRSEPTSWEEVLDITSLLFNELAAAAADCTEPSLQCQLSDFIGKAERLTEPQDIVHYEKEFQQLLFSMVERPLFALLTRVALAFAEGQPDAKLAGGFSNLEEWRDGRIRIISAVLNNDGDLARFEANRCNRQPILRSIGLAD